VFRRNEFGRNVDLSAAKHPDGYLPTKPTRFLTILSRQDTGNRDPTPPVGLQDVIRAYWQSCFQCIDKNISCFWT
jgi:hypothetical protein